MKDGNLIAVVIPALNEEQSLGKVLRAIPPWVDDVIVGDNGSTDRTPQVAVECGARVVHEPRRGYGSACMAAMAVLDCPDIVVFLDGDFSDYPQEADLLVDPIVRGDADMVLGSRVLGRHEPGALTPQAMFGNWLSCRLIGLVWGVKFTDLGPFRAVRYTALQRLNMRDPDYGWTVEMQIKAARAGLRVREVPVSYRRRIGKSKVSGTIKGVIGAGTKILGTIFLAAAGLLPGDESRHSDEALIVFTRYPVPGETKTRLIPTLGPEGAADLQREMTEFTVGKLRDLVQRNELTVNVFFDGSDAVRMSQWLGREFAYHHQGDGDLGLRMLNAFRRAFARGAERTVIVGTDCPGLNRDTVLEAFQELRKHDLVLGPATDGGYYLIGAQRPQPDVFTDVPWGTEEVLQTTLRTAATQGLSVKLLQEMGDVDRPEDVRFWEDATHNEEAPLRNGAIPTADLSVSVIIPTLNEEENISATVHEVRTGEEVEIIVVDGGSSDRTVALARECGARVLQSPRGRSAQMNAGARQASGEILLFLHADTRLPANWLEHVVGSFDSPETVGGAFLLNIDGDHPGLRIIEKLANIRSSWLQIPYGDQAIYLPRDMFRQIGGFPDVPIMEDFEMVRKLRGHGRLKILPVPAVTSGRRWKRQGVWKTTFLHQVMILGNLAGLPLDTLARLYQKESL